MRIIENGPFSYKPRKAEEDIYKSLREPQRELEAENPYLAQGLEILHVGNDIWLDRVKDGIGPQIGGGAAAVVAVGALGMGLARMRSDALPDKIDAAGHIALGVHSALEALHIFGGPEVPYPAMGALKVVHGLATVAVGISDIKRAPEGPRWQRYAVGGFGVALGVAVTASGLLPNLAPTLNLVAGGALIGKELALNWRHLSQKSPAPQTA